MVVGRRLRERAADALFFRIVHAPLSVIGVKLPRDAAS